MDAVAARAVLTGAAFVAGFPAPARTGASGGASPFAATAGAGGRRAHPMNGPQPEPFAARPRRGYGRFTRRCAGWTDIHPRRFPMGTRDDDRTRAERDANRDPITGTPGSHPVGVGIGGAAGGAAAGAAAGAVFGPIGTLVGAAAGVVAGAAIGKRVAERIDPTGEEAYWRQAHRERPYVKPEYDYDRDYAAAYGFGLQAREADLQRGWDESEAALRTEWDQARGDSRLSWEEAREAVRDAWERADRTHATYARSDAYFADAFERADYREPDARFEDYRPAYRYGVEARGRHADRGWDEALETELAGDWPARRGASPLEWDRARAAVRDAYVSHDRYSGDSYARQTPGRGDPDRFTVG